MPEGSAALIFWVYVSGWSLLPLSTAVALNRRLRVLSSAGHARKLTWAMAVAMALVNVSIGAALLHFFLGELDKPRLGPELRVAWEVTATPMALAIAVLQVVVGGGAAGHVLWLARAAMLRSKSE